jgi:hypothetical protein
MTRSSAVWAAGGAGQIDIVTPYMGYIPFLRRRI